LVVAGTAHAQCDNTHYKPGEYQMYADAAKEVTGNQFDKAITDLKAWETKIPDSACKNQRDVLLIQAYSGAKQTSQLLAATAALIAQPDAASLPANDMIRVLFLSTQAIPTFTAATPEDTANGEKIAKALLAFDKKPDGMADAQWTQVKGQLQAAAKGALLTMAVRPGVAALAQKPQDCATAETSLGKALQDYPDNAFIAFYLGSAYICEVVKDQSKYEQLYPKALYEMARAIALDPTLGGTQNGQTITDQVVKRYNNFHGGNDGFDQLKEQAKASPMPPDGFTIETAAKVSARKENEFKEKYPQLALWMGIKRQLTDANSGQQYFDGTLKSADVKGENGSKAFKGVIVEGKPACRSKELLVAVPEPNQQGTPVAEIKLKLDAPLTGKPEAGEIQWDGVPSDFSRDPFLLTMDTEKAKIEGLKTTPCAPAAAHPGARKGVTKKK
jgi:hypothetical protein